MSLLVVLALDSDTVPLGSGKATPHLCGWSEGSHFKQMDIPGINDVVKKILGKE